MKMNTGITVILEACCRHSHSSHPHTLCGLRTHIGPLTSTVFLRQASCRVYVPGEKGLHWETLKIMFFGGD